MHSVKQLAAVGLLGLGVLASQHSHAATTTYYVTMDCADCAQTADRVSYPVWAALTLEDYVLGTQTTTEANQFVSFVYSGSNLVAPFSLTHTGDDGNPATVDYLTHKQDEPSPNYWFSANIDQLPGANNFYLSFEFSSVAWNNYYFWISSSGDWSMCAPGASGIPMGGGCTIPSDYGTGAVFSTTPVPEPEQALLLGAGLMLVGGAARRAQKRS